MTSIHSIQTGDKVKGLYMDVPYTGVVDSQRPHTMNHRITLFFVTLDQPITVFGFERDGINLCLSDDAAAQMHFLGSDHIDSTIQHA